MRVIFITRDGKRRKIKEKLALHLKKAGKGYIEGQHPFVAEAAKTADAKPADLFQASGADGSAEKHLEDETPAAPDEEKANTAPRRGRPSRASQDYKTRMLKTEPTEGDADSEQSYSTTDLSAE